MSLNPNLINFEYYRNNWEWLLDNKQDYFIFVRALTEINYNVFLNIVNPKLLKRGFRKNNHLDHIYSISEGFKNKINPYFIAHPMNLQMLKAKENKRKGSTCGHTIEILLEKIESFGEV